MNVPTYLLALHVHGPRFTTPYSFKEKMVYKVKKKYGWQERYGPKYLQDQFSLEATIIFKKLFNHPPQGGVSHTGFGEPFSSLERNGPERHN